MTDRRGGLFSAATRKGKSMEGWIFGRRAEEEETIRIFDRRRGSGRHAGQRAETAGVAGDLPTDGNGPDIRTRSFRSASEEEEQGVE